MEQFQEPKGEMDVLSAGLSPTYWRPLVNPSVLRDLRLDTYFNFTFRFQPFILQKEVVLG